MKSMQENQYNYEKSDYRKRDGREKRMAHNDFSEREVQNPYSYLALR